MIPVLVVIAGIDPSKPRASGDDPPIMILDRSDAA